MCERRECPHTQRTNTQRTNIIYRHSLLGIQRCCLLVPWGWLECASMILWWDQNIRGVSHILNYTTDTTVLAKHPPNQLSRWISSPSSLLWYLAGQQLKATLYQASARTGKNLQALHLQGSHAPYSHYWSICYESDKKWWDQEHPEDDNGYNGSWQWRSYCWQHL